MKRTIYADREGLINQLQLERQAALDNTAVTNIPHYRKHHWRGRAEGLAFAAALLRDWAGEETPEPVLACTVCGGPLELSQQYPDAGYLHRNASDDAHVPMPPGS